MSVRSGMIPCPVFSKSQSWSRVVEGSEITQNSLEQPRTAQNSPEITQNIPEQPRTALTKKYSCDYLRADLVELLGGHEETATAVLLNTEDLENRLES